MKRTLLGFIVVSLSCCAKPSPESASYAVTEEDEYAIYRAIIDLDAASYPGVSATVDAAVSQERVEGLAHIEAPKGFDPAALADFNRARVGTKRLEAARLSRSANGDTMNVKYTFMRIGFDGRGITAVTYGSKLMEGQGRGNLYSLARTVDGKWAVTRIRMIWTS